MRRPAGRRGRAPRRGRSTVGPDGNELILAEFGVGRVRLAADADAIDPRPARPEGAAKFHDAAPLKSGIADAH